MSSNAEEDAVVELCSNHISHFEEAVERCLHARRYHWSFERKVKIAFQIAFILLLAVWAGVIAGVSLLATPVKFQAHLLTMQAGLEVGRYTFRWLARIEIGFLLATVIAASIAQPCRFAWVAVAAVVVTVLLQRYWLLPALDAQVGEILAGGPISFSYHHVLYAIFEVVKVGLLIAAGAIELYYRVKAAGLGRIS